MARKTKAETGETRVLFARIPAVQLKQLKLLAVEREQPVAELVQVALERFLKEAHRGK